MVLLSTLSFGLTDEQLNKIQIAYNVGKSIKAKDGMTFERGLPSVMGQESSFGVYVVGDKWEEDGRLKSLYESSLGNMQIKLSTAKLTIKQFPELRKKYNHLVYDGDSIYLEYQNHKKKMDYYKKLTVGGVEKLFEKQLLSSKHLEKLNYYKSILKNPIWIDRFKKKQQKAIQTFDWAKRQISYHEAEFDKEADKLKKSLQKSYNDYVEKYEYHRKKYVNLSEKANKDTRLINMLLTNYKFGVEIGGYYLRWMYEIALDKGFSNAYWRAIGRYNGGWNNTEYQEKVRNRMQLVNELIKEGKIS